MCWLLIRAFDDAKATAWKIGDIVEVRPDDFVGWGTLEGLPRFYRVQVTGVDATVVKRILERTVDGTMVAIDGKTIPKLDRIRDYQLTLADLPAALRTTLETTGQIVLTRAQARAAIKDHLGVRANL